MEIGIMCFILAFIIISFCIHYLKTDHINGQERMIIKAIRKAFGICSFDEDEEVYRKVYDKMKGKN